MARIQILVRSWGVQNKEFVAVSQTDLTRGLASSVAQAYLIL